MDIVEDFVGNKKFSIKVGDEGSFVQYSEYVIYKLQELWRRKEGLEFEPVIDVCEKLEDHLFSRTVIQNAPVPQEQVWMNKQAIVWFQDKVRRILHNLETKDRPWKRIFDDNRANPQNLLTHLLREETQSIKRRKPAAETKTKRTKLTKSVSFVANAEGVYGGKKRKMTATNSKSAVPPVPSSVSIDVLAGVAKGDSIPSFDKLMEFGGDDDFDLGLDFEDSNAGMSMDVFSETKFDDDAWKSNPSLSNGDFFNGLEGHRLGQEDDELYRAKSEVEMDRARRDAIMHQHSSSIRLSASRPSLSSARLSSAAFSQLGGQPHHEDEITFTEAERRRAGDEQRQRERREREAQEQTVDLDHYALREELGEFMKL